MNYITGNTLKKLREKQGMTQNQLAELLSVSDKTISKWETERGMPDISILADLAKALEVSIPELLTDNVIQNNNRPANMKKTHFYVCPICGNVIHSIGEGAFSCHGILLPELLVEESDEKHSIQIEIQGYEYHIHMNHEMNKSHHISFLAYVTDDMVLMKKLYPEQEADCYFTRCGHGIIYAYCNRHGLFAIKK